MSIAIWAQLCPDQLCLSRDILHIYLYMYRNAVMTPVSAEHLRNMRYLSGVLCLMRLEFLYDGVDSAKRSRQHYAEKVVVLCLASGVACAVRA